MRVSSFATKRPNMEQEANDNASKRNTVRAVPNCCANCKAAFESREHRKLSVSLFKTWTADQQQKELIEHGVIFGEEFTHEDGRIIPAPRNTKKKNLAILKERFISAGKTPLQLTQLNPPPPSDEDKDPERSKDAPPDRKENYLPGYGTFKFTTNPVEYFGWFRRDVTSTRADMNGMLRPLPTELSEQMPDLKKMDESGRQSWILCLSVIVKNYTLSYEAYSSFAKTVAALPNSTYTAVLDRKAFGVARMVVLVLAERLCDMKLVAAHGIVGRAYAGESIHGLYEFDDEKAWLLASGYMVLGGDGCWPIRG